MLFNTFIFWLATLPLIVFNLNYEGSKLIYFFLGSFFVAAFWVYRILKSQKELRLSKVDVLFILWLFVLTLASLLGIHPLESIVGGSYRHQGVIFFLSLWLIGKTVEILRANQKNLLKMAIAVSILAEVLVVFGQLVSKTLYFGRPLGTLGETNAVAGFLAIGLYFVSETFPRILITLPIAILLVTGSRSGVLAALPFFWRIRKKYIYIVLVLTAALFIGFLSFRKTISIFENRSLFWKFGKNAVFQRPILGYGAESGEYVYDKAFRKAEMPLEDLIIDRSHNLFLDVAIWSGILGLGIFLYWLYRSFISLDDLPRRLAFLSFLVFAMQPWPVAWTLVDGKRIKLLKAHVEDNGLELDEVQLEGKNPVSYRQFKDAYPSLEIV